MSFVEQVAGLVTKKLQEPNPTGVITSFWRNYERATPTVVTEKVENTTPPNHFSTPIFETDLNDSFDESALLKKVPKSHHTKAKTLLKHFDERPNELTWDSSGNIYIDEKVIPNANIFALFPLLFRRKVSKKHTGIDDFLTKIQSMGLSSLIKLQSKISTMPAVNSIINPDYIKNEKWWFLGE